MELRFDALVKNAFSATEWDHLLHDEEFCCLVEQVRTSDQYFNTVEIGCQILLPYRDTSVIGRHGPENSNN